MIREIVRPQKRQLVIDIPGEYVQQEVEILIFPLSEAKVSPLKRKTSKNLLQFRKLMEKARKADIKVPANVDIDDLIDEINDDIY